jgi:hypothetical protein
MESPQPVREFERGTFALTVEPVPQAAAGDRADRNAVPAVAK